MEKFISDMRERAKKLNKRIIFPEDNDRIRKASEILKKENIVRPISPKDHEGLKDEMAKRFFELRKHKDITEQKAREAMEDRQYFSTMLLHEGYADGLVSGSEITTAETLRPALQIIKTKEGIKLASSFFFMLVNDKKYLFADCGFNIKPDAEQLSEIAYATVQSASFFDMEPRVSFLSFSTKGSADHEDVKKVQEAVRLFSKKDPDCIYDGELQLDASIVPDVARKKAPDSPLKGNANVLIFPDLGAGNIGYKLVQRLGGATALGPIVQGLNKPVNDLSRGCNVEDIVDVAAITAIQG